MAEEIKNMSMNIVVDDGSRRVPIINTHGEEIGAFTFRPTDVGIIKRYNEMVTGFDSIVEPLEGLYGAGDDITDPKYTEALNAAEGRLYAAVNTLFASDDAAGAFFGKMNPFSPVDGEFYCAKVLNGVGDYISAAFDTETAKFSANAKKYAKKATRK
jgi:hypothetical protein